MRFLAQSGAPTYTMKYRVASCCPCSITRSCSHDGRSYIHRHSYRNFAWDIEVSDHLARGGFGALCLEQSRHHFQTVCKHPGLKLPYQSII